jgi:hypothetical protein
MKVMTKSPLESLMYLYVDESQLPRFCYVKSLALHNSTNEARSDNYEVITNWVKHHGITTALQDTYGVSWTCIPRTPSNIAIGSRH